MTLSIYTARGRIIYTLESIYEGCLEKVTLMEEDYIELHFSLASPLLFPIGSYCTWNGRKFEVTEIQQPTYNESTGGWDYELKLEAYYMAWKNRIYKYVPQIGGNSEASFSITDKLPTHAEALARSLNAEGFTFNDKPISVAIDGTAGKEYKDETITISYSSSSFLDALATIAENFECEWWVIDDVIHFGKCQTNEETAVDFRLGDNVEKMENSQTDQDYATRVWAYGSTNNMPLNWNKGSAIFTCTKATDVTKTDTDESDGTTQTIKQTEWSINHELKGKYFSKTDKQSNNTISLYSFSIDRHGMKVKWQNVDYGLNFNVDNYARNYGNKIPIEGASWIKLKKGSYGEMTDYDKVFALPSLTLAAQLSYISMGVKCSFDVYKKENNKETCIAVGECGEEASFNKVSADVFLAKLLTPPIPKFQLTEASEIRIDLILTFTSADKDGNGTLNVPESKLLQLGYETYASPSYNLKVILEDSEGSGTFTGTPIDASFSTADGNTILTEYGTASKYSGKRFIITNVISSKLPTSYFDESTKTSEGMIKAIAETRLSLPDSGFVNYPSDADLKNGEIVEKVLVFDDIYPRIEAAITDVQTGTFTQKVEYANGEEEEKYTGYFIKTDEYTFDKDYQLSTDENMQIKFTTGALAGMTFDCTFGIESNNKHNETVLADGQYFFIVYTEAATNYWLPAGSLVPKVGDKFIVIGWDSSRMEDLGLIEKAQKELLEETEKELADMAIDPNTYDCTMMSDYVYGIDPGGKPDEDYSHTFQIGRRVNLYSDAYFKDGMRESRIQGYERKMDLPYDCPIYTVGEKATYSKFSELQDQIDGINISGESISKLTSIGTTTSGNGTIYLITTNDTTRESDTNAYSASRTKQDYLSKKNDDNEWGQIYFQRGTVNVSSTDYNDRWETAADGIIEEIK